MPKKEPKAWASLGVSTVYEAAGRSGLLDVPMERVVPGSRAAGRARTVLCGQGDNLGVDIAIDRLQPGEVLVATMPEPEPVALFGEVLAVFAKARGAAAVLIDAAVRDRDELLELGLPVWARWISSKGPIKSDPGLHEQPVVVCGQPIAQGDVVVLDGDGVVVVSAEREDEVMGKSHQRARLEGDWFAQLIAGASTLDLMELRGEKGAER